MTTYKVLEGLRGGLTALFIGPPKTGKSTLLGSAAEVFDNCLLLTAKASELNSWLYRKHGIDQTAEVFADLGWRPALDRYAADGFKAAMETIVGLYDDDTTDCVLVEFTDFVGLAKHARLSPQNVATPDDLPGKGDKIGFYGGLKDDLNEFTQMLVNLASPSLKKPKHVLVAVHAQATRDDDIKGNESREAKVRGVEYFGEVLPMVEGSYRLKMASEFDLVGYTSIQHEMVRDGVKMTRQTRYTAQLKADNERHAGFRLAPALSEKLLDNSMKAILEAADEALEDD